MDGSDGNLVKGIRIEEMSLGPGPSGALPSRLLDLYGGCNQIYVRRVATQGPASISHFSVRTDGSHNGPDTVNFEGCNANPGGSNAVPYVLDVVGSLYGPGDLTTIGGQFTAPSTSGHVLRLSSAGLISVGTTWQTFGDRHGILAERPGGLGPLPVCKGSGTIEAGGGTGAITMETWDNNPDPAAVLHWYGDAGGVLALLDGSTVPLSGRAAFWADQGLHTRPFILGPAFWAHGTGPGSAALPDPDHPELDSTTQGDGYGNVIHQTPATHKFISADGVQAQGTPDAPEGHVRLVYALPVFPGAVYPVAYVKISSDGNAHLIPMTNCDVELDGLNIKANGALQINSAGQQAKLYPVSDGTVWLQGTGPFRVAVDNGVFMIQGASGQPEPIVRLTYLGGSNPTLDLALDSSGRLRIAENQPGEIRIDPTLGLCFKGSTTALPTAGSALRGHVYNLLSSVGGVPDKLYLCQYDGAGYSWKLFTLT